MMFIFKIIILNFNSIFFEKQIIFEVYEFFIFYSYYYKSFLYYVSRACNIVVIK